MGCVARTRDMRDAYEVLIGKSERKRKFGRPRCRWKDNIGMNLREIW